eukprot:5404110-Pyramimonas_sp.AAC.1
MQPGHRYQTDARVHYDERVTYVVYGLVSARAWSRVTVRSRQVGRRKPPQPAARTGREGNPQS